MQFTIVAKPMSDGMLSISLLGELRGVREGVEIPQPSSR